MGKRQKRVRGMRGTRTATGGVSTVQNEDSVIEQVARGGGQEAEAKRTAIRVNCGAEWDMMEPADIFHI